MLDNEDLAIIAQMVVNPQACELLVRGRVDLAKKLLFAKNGSSIVLTALELVLYQQACPNIVLERVTELGDSAALYRVNRNERVILELRP